MPRELSHNFMTTPSIIPQALFGLHEMNLPSFVICHPEQEAGGICPFTLLALHPSEQAPVPLKTLLRISFHQQIMNIQDLCLLNLW